MFAVLDGNRLLKTHFDEKIKWWLEHMGTLGVMGEMAPAQFRKTLAATKIRQHANGRIYSNLQRWEELKSLS